MKTKSRRARRMERHHKIRKGSPLNLVSLMDIFTILVFFLLVNSSNAPQLPTQKDLTLPTSTAQKVPQETPVLVVTPQTLLLQGREVAAVSELAASEGKVFEPLLQALQQQAQNRQLQRQGDEPQKAITIMADEDIPYALLDKLLATCRQAGYNEIAFAAHQKAKPKQPG